MVVDLFMRRPMDEIEEAVEALLVLLPGVENVEEDVEEGVVTDVEDPVVVVVVLLDEWVVELLVVVESAGVVFRVGEQGRMVAGSLLSHSIKSQCCSLSKCCWSLYAFGIT